MYLFRDEQKRWLKIYYVTRDFGPISSLSIIFIMLNRGSIVCEPRDLTDCEGSLSLHVELSSPFLSFLARATEKRFDTKVNERLHLFFDE